MRPEDTWETFHELDGNATLKREVLSGTEYRNESIMSSSAIRASALVQILSKKCNMLFLSQHVGWVR